MNKTHHIGTVYVKRNTLILSDMFKLRAAKSEHAL